MIDLSSKYNFKKFNKEQRSSFSYWYYHWKAFNLTAFHLGCWKFKYLFHDIEKPWLMLFWKNYFRVQSYHRFNSNHHLEYEYFDEIDWEALVIDWECSRFTKNASPRNAYREMLSLKSLVSPEFYKKIRDNMMPIILRYGLDE